MIAHLALAVMLTTQAAPQKLHWEPVVDLSVTGGLGLSWILSETAFKKPLAPTHCRWCQTNAFDTWVRSAFNPSLSPSAEGVTGIHVVSNIVGFAGLPVAVFGVSALLSLQEGPFLETFPIDVVLMLEASMSALVLNQAVKFAVGRARPYTVGASEELLALGHDVPDNNLSFFSGHTTFAFAMATSGATVASLRGYRYAWAMWAVGLPLAFTTAILRLAADKHWASDVLVGAAIGTAAGVLMPTFLHGRVGPVTARVAPMSNGLALSGRF